MSNKGGYVYVLSNPSMPGLVKVGFTRRSARHRGWEMYEKMTGVPTPFVFEFEVWCKDPEVVEAMVFERLQNYRVNQYREFFRIDLQDAIVAVLHEVAAEYDQSVEDVEYALDPATVPWLMAGFSSLGTSVPPPAVVRILEEVTAKELLPALDRYRKRQTRQQAVTLN